MLGKAVRVSLTTTPKVFFPYRIEKVKSLVQFLIELHFVFVRAALYTQQH